MVSTRNHPSNFPPPDLSPSKAAATHPMSSSTGPWAHKPTVLTVLWLIVSLPLVIWDSIYVLGRPHTMPGGKWHEPVYTPYALYATVDYMYGWPAYESGNGFTMAQCSLNVLETICYLAYLYIFWEHGEGQWTYVRGQQRSIGGGWGGLACLSAFSVSLLTFSKTVLYGTWNPFSKIYRASLIFTSYASLERTLLQLPLYWAQQRLPSILLVDPAQVSQISTS